MARRWIEDDPFDDGDASLAEPAHELRPPGAASVMGLGSVVSMLLLVLTALALVD